MIYRMPGSTLLVKLDLGQDDGSAILLTVIRLLTDLG